MSNSSISFSGGMGLKYYWEVNGFAYLLTSFSFLLLIILVKLLPLLKPAPDILILKFVRDCDLLSILSILSPVWILNSFNIFNEGASYFFFFDLLKFSILIFCYFSSFLFLTVSNASNNTYLNLFHITFWLLLVYLSYL